MRFGETDSNLYALASSDLSLCQHLEVGYM